MQRFNTKQLVVMGLMIAMEIILSRFLAIQTPTIRIGFGFLAIAVTAMLYGPISAAIVGALADIIGVTFFTGNALFPGFTVTAVLMGLVYGLFMHKRMGKTMPIVIAVLIVTIVLQLGLDTHWVHMLTGTPHIALLPPRVIRTIIMIPVQIILIKVIARVLISEWR